MKKAILIIGSLLVLPVFLHVYNPSMQLGGLGLALGAIGMMLSPLIILYLIYYWVSHEWNK